MTLKYIGWKSLRLRSSLYQGRSKTNVSYPIILAHDVRSGCWWYGNRLWTFPPITGKFCCSATFGSRGAVWQKNGIWHESAYNAKVCNWIPPCGKKCTHWHRCLLNVYRDPVRLLAQWDWGWRISTEVTAKGNRQITTRELCKELNIGFNALETIIATS